MADNFFSSLQNLNEDSIAKICSDAIVQIVVALKVLKTIDKEKADKAQINLKYAIDKALEPTND